MKDTPWNEFQVDASHIKCVAAKPTSHNPHETASIMAKRKPAQGGANLVRKRITELKFDPYATEAGSIGQMAYEALNKERVEMTAKWNKSLISCDETLYAQKYVESMGHNPYMDKNTR